MNNTEKIIVAFLKGKEKETLDRIALSCDLPIYAISSALLNLELKGIIRPNPGKQFEYIG